jgi:broad specificity phosphatase PhoE
MEILVIRHARTIYNEQELINGGIADDQLSPAGLAQIPDIIRSVEGYSFTEIYASTMIRSIETATPIAEHFHVPLKQDARIIEVNMGSFNGKPWRSTVPIFGLNSSDLLSTCEYDFSHFGGESAADTKARVMSFIDELKQNTDSKPLIVCHGGVMRWLYYISTGEKSGRIPNGKVLELKF